MTTQRTAIITGSSRGIGLASVFELFRRGYRVFGVDLSPPATTPEWLEFIKADVGSQDDVRQVVKRIELQTDCIDVLVNNAAVCPRARLEETVLDQWNRALAVNLTGPFLMIRGVLPLLKRSPNGSIVNVASVHALGTSTAVAAYAASKGGLVSLSRALALELAEYGIRVNCLLPGAVNTSMLQEGLSSRLFEAGTPEEGLERLAARTPLKRVGTPEEMAKAIGFLSSTEESSFMTGQTLVVDGGALARLSTE